MHIMIIKICNHTNMHVLIFLCLIGQGKIEISQGKSGKSQGILISYSVKSNEACSKLFLIGNINV